MHASWVSDLERAVGSGACPMTEAQAADDHACELGKWLDSQPAEEPHIADVRRIHREFHAAASAVVACVCGGDAAAAEKLLLDRFTASSTALVAGLLRLESLPVR